MSPTAEERLEMFVNISNHPSPKWGPEQLAAAVALGGTVRDIAFPNVPPAADFAAVDLLADSLIEGISAGDVVMVQGEAALCFAATRKLLAKGARVVVASTERRSVETTNPDGTVTKTAVFGFVIFREII